MKLTNTYEKTVSYKVNFPLATTWVKLYVDSMKSRDERWKVTEETTRKSSFKFVVSGRENNMVRPESQKFLKRMAQGMLAYRGMLQNETIVVAYHYDFVITGQPDGDDATSITTEVRESIDPDGAYPGLKDGKFTVESRTETLRGVTSEFHQTVRIGCEDLANNPQ